MTLGTDPKFTLSFPSPKSLCWGKRYLFSFKTQKLSSDDNLNANGQGLPSDMDSAVLSVSHGSVTSTFQGQLLLSNSCWTASFCSRLMPLKAPPLCPNYDWHERACTNFHSQRHTFRNWGFNSLTQEHADWIFRNTKTTTTLRPARLLEDLRVTIFTCSRFSNVHWCIKIASQGQEIVSLQ